MADPATPQPIDLSAGLVPKPATDAGGIDLSAGMVPKSTSGQSAPSPTASDDDASYGIHPLYPKVVQDVGKGILKGAGQTVNTVSGLLNKIPGIGETLAPKAGIAAAEKMETPVNTAEKVGAGAEGIMEFVAGDEALKGLSLAEKLGLGAKIAKIAEDSPAASKIIRAGLNALRVGTVGTAQGLVKGESLLEAAKTGAVAGGTGLALEPVAAGVQKLAPAIKDIAGEKIPVRASQESKAAAGLEEVSRSKPLQKFDVEQTQPAAKKAVGAIATDVPSKSVSIGTKASAPAADLGARADQIRAESKPMFEKLDDLTKGQDTKFSDWQKKERMAYRKGDYDAVKTARDAQEKIWTDNAGQFSPDDFKNARANWRQASALDKVHDAINTKAIVQPTPVDFRAEGKPDPGYINGKNFSKAILNLKNKAVFQDAGLTPKHVQALQDLGTLLEKSGGVQDQGDALSKAIKAAKIAVKGAAGTATAGTGFLASAALGKIMTDEKAATGLVKALRSVGPAAAAGAARKEPTGNSGSL